MKKILFLFAILIISVIGFSVVTNSKNLFKIDLNPSKITYKLNNKNYKLLVARTSQEWEKGLMDYRKLENADGMIFIFPDKKDRFFWNQNTYMDLDVYWLDGDKVVGKEYLPSIEKNGEVIISSSQPVDKVIEIVRY